jgi:hypothetical protein
MLRNAADMERALAEFKTLNNAANSLDRNWGNTISDIATYGGAGFSALEYGVLNPATNYIGKLQDISQANNLGLNYLKEDMILRQTGKFMKVGGRFLNLTSVAMAGLEFKQTDPWSDAQFEAGVNVVMNSFGFLPVIGPGYSIYWNLLGGRQLNSIYVEKVLVPRYEMIERAGADLSPWDLVGK